MLYLVINSDETFELRWIDYYSISGFDDLLSMKAPSLPQQVLPDQTSALDTRQETISATDFEKNKKATEAIDTMIDNILESK